MAQIVRAMNNSTASQLDDFRVYEAEMASICADLFIIFYYYVPGR